MWMYQSTTYNILVSIAGSGQHNTFVLLLVLSSRLPEYTQKCSLGARQRMSWYQSQSAWHGCWCAWCALEKLRTKLLCTSSQYITRFPTDPPSYSTARHVVCQPLSRFRQSLEIDKKYIGANQERIRAIRAVRSAYSLLVQSYPRRSRLGLVLQEELKSAGHCRTQYWYYVQYQGRLSAGPQYLQPPPPLSCMAVLAPNLFSQRLNGSSLMYCMCYVWYAPVVGPSRRQLPDLRTVYWLRLSQLQKMLSALSSL